MEDGLVLVDDLSEGLVELAGVDVFGAVLEVAEESAGFGEGGAGAFRCPKLLLNSLPSTPELGVVFLDSVMLMKTLRASNQPTTITCDRVEFRGEDHGACTSMGKTEYFGWTKRFIRQSKKGS
jgi:hypothetical protein